MIWGLKRFFRKQKYTAVVNVALIVFSAILYGANEWYLKQRLTSIFVNAQ